MGRAIELSGKFTAFQLRPTKRTTDPANEDNGRTFDYSQRENEF